MTTEEPEKKEKKGQRERLLEDLRNYCNNREVPSRTFTLQEYTAHLRADGGSGFVKLGITSLSKNPVLRRLLQELRDRSELEFVDGRGTYTLLNCLLLDEELDPDLEKFISKEKDLYREYLNETLSRRDSRLVLAARDLFGKECMYPSCQNSFVKDSGDKYIEVHHIKPLCEGGKDSLENLSVVCAHHHRMAHFAEVTMRNKVMDDLLRANQEKLAIPT